MAIPVHLADAWPDSDEHLRVSRISDCCTVLGPGKRGVIWLQGCVFRCAECIVPEMLPFAGGEILTIAEVAQHFAGLPTIEGLTFSGGEPLSQAAALVALIDQLRTSRDMSFVCYTGYTLEQLRDQGSKIQLALLDRLDLLIDGPYLPERHTQLRWRGSDNQQIHFLSDRYRHLQPSIHDQGRWMEFELLNDGTLTWMGIPPRGFRSEFSQALQRAGILYTSEEKRS